MISLNYRKTAKGVKKLNPGAKKTVDAHRALKKKK